MRNVYDCVEAFGKLLDKNTIQCWEEKMFPFLESIIDSCDTIFKYNRKLNAYSVINVDYTKNQASWTLLYLRRESLFQQEKKKYCMTG